MSPWSYAVKPWILPVVDPEVRRWPNPGTMMLMGIPPYIAQRYGYVRHAFTCGLVCTVLESRN